MQVIGGITSPFKYEVTLPETANLTPIKELIVIINKMAENHGSTNCIKATFDTVSRNVSVSYIAKNIYGVGCYAGTVRGFKRASMEKGIAKLVRLCNLLLSDKEIKLLNGNSVPCMPIEHISSFENIDKNTERQLFDGNVNLFLANADVILSDSRMFLSPVFCSKSCFFDGVPTLGVFVEFWQKCVKESIVDGELPICFISGNPMTGSYACAAVTPDGKFVKVRLHIEFIELLKLFGNINSRYKSVRDICHSYTLEDVVKRLNGIEQ